MLTKAVKHSLIERSVSCDKIVRAVFLWVCGDNVFLVLFKGELSLQTVQCSANRSLAYLRGRSLLGGSGRHNLWKQTETLGKSRGRAKGVPVSNNHASRHAKQTSVCTQRNVFPCLCVYRMVLTEISELQSETQTLEQQNTELRMLLQQTLNSKVCMFMFMVLLCFLVCVTLFPRYTVMVRVNFLCFN